jgi:hypothetical protein
MMTLEDHSSPFWLADLQDHQRNLIALCREKADDEAIGKALCDILAAYEPVEKPWVFLALERSLSPAAFWRGLHQHWPCFSEIPHGRFSWLFGCRRPGWKAEYMSQDDALRYAELPETLTVRKQRDRGARIALSWTLDPMPTEEAAGAARDGMQPGPVAFEAIVSKSDVAGLYRLADATEIVVFSARLAKRKSASRRSDRSHRRA